MTASHPQGSAAAQQEADWKSQRALVVAVLLIGLLLGGFGLWLGIALLIGGWAPLVGDVDQSVVLGIITLLLTFPVTGAVLKGITLVWMLVRSRP